MGISVADHYVYGAGISQLRESIQAQIEELQES
jgi:hypothetical protein